MTESSSNPSPDSAGVMGAVETVPRLRVRCNPWVPSSLAMVRSSPPLTERWQGLAAAGLYGLSSFTMAFINKAVLTSYGFNFPLFLLAMQMAVTMVMLKVLSVRGVMSLPPYSLAAGRTVLWQSLFFGLHGSLTLYALHGLNIPMHSAIKRCTPLMTLLLAVLVLRKARPSLLLVTSVFVISGGCFVAALGDLTFDPAAYGLGLLSVVAQGLYMTLVQQYTEAATTSTTAFTSQYQNGGVYDSDKKTAVQVERDLVSTSKSSGGVNGNAYAAVSLRILQLNAYNTLLPFMGMSVVVGEPARMVKMTCWSKPDFVLLLVFLVAVGCLFQYSLFLCTALTSALTTSLVGVAKSSVQTVLGFFILGGVRFHPLNVLGIVINSLGGVLYVYAKYIEKEKPVKPKYKWDHNLNVLTNGSSLKPLLRSSGEGREEEMGVSPIQVKIT